MADASTVRCPTFQKYAEAAAGLVAVAGSGILFCPLWSGDWSRPAVTIWLTVVASMSLIVGLYVLSKRLYRDRHETLAMLVIVSIVPILDNATWIVGGRGFGPFPDSFGGVVDRLFGGYSGLATIVVVVVIQIVRSIGGLPSRLFPLVDQQRSREARPERPG